MFLFAALVAALIDILTVKEIKDVIIVLIAVLWIAGLKIARLEGRFSILTGLVFLMIACLFLIIKIEFVAEKAAVWAFIFLSIGIFQQLKEYKTKSRDLNTLDSFYQNLIKDIKRNN